jgi:GTPase
MKKSFILTGKPWGYSFMALYFLFYAVSGYLNDEKTTLGYWAAVLSGLAFIAVIFYLLFVVTDVMGTAPKVEVHNEGLLLRGRPFTSGRKISWEEVQSITFHHYQIDLKLDTEPVFFSYRSSAAVSKRIKEAIRDMADLKNIEVKGG